MWKIGGIKSQHAVDINHIQCEAIFSHPMATLKLGGLWDPNDTISWNLVFMQVLTVYDF